MDAEHSDKLLETVRTASREETGGAPSAALHALYSAVVEGDFDRLHDLVAEDVTLHISGFAPMNGDWHGREEMVAATQRIRRS